MLPWRSQLYEDNCGYTSVRDFSRGLLGITVQSETSVGSKALLKPHPLPHFGPIAFPFFPLRHRLAASQLK